MSESLTRIPFKVVPPKKQMDLFRMHQTKTYSLTVGDVELVKAMRAMLPPEVRRKISEGEIVRRAIRMLSENFEPSEFGLEETGGGPV